MFKDAALDQMCGRDGIGGMAGALPLRKIEWIDYHVANARTPPCVGNVQKSIRALYDSRVGVFPIPRFQKKRIAPRVPLICGDRNMKGIPSMEKVVVHKHKPAVLHANDINSSIGIRQ
jgi:hypothetical protein